MSNLPNTPHGESIGAAPYPAHLELVGRELQDTDLRDRHFAHLIFLSYRLSQGGIGTQNRILMYVEEHFYPDLMNGERTEIVKELTHRIVGSYFLDQRLHPSTAIPWEDDSPEALASVKTDVTVTNELEGLFERFHNREEISDFDSDIPGIAQSVIVMDGDYLSRPDGRAGDSSGLKITVGPYKRDPYESMFVKYGVLGTKTGAKEFDEIFSQVAEVETLRQLDGHSLKRLKFVIDTYCMHHPEKATDKRMVLLKQVVSDLADGGR